MPPVQREVREGQIAVGHGPITQLRPGVGEQQIAASADAHQLSAFDIHHMLVLVGDRPPRTSRSAHPRAAAPPWRPGCGRGRRTAPVMTPPPRRPPSTARRHAPAAVSARDARRPEPFPSTQAPACTTSKCAWQRGHRSTASLRPNPADGAAPRLRATRRSTAAVAVGEQLGHRAGRPAPWCPRPRTRRPLPARGRRRRAPDATHDLAVACARGSSGCPPESPQGVASGSAATTSIDEISGAAARTASSTASSRVTDDDGQLLQLPANCSRTTSPSTSSRWTSPPCEPR